MAKNLISLLVLPLRGLSCASIAELYSDRFMVAVTKHHSQVSLQKDHVSWAPGSRGLVYNGGEA